MKIVFFERWALIFIFKNHVMNISVGSYALATTAKKKKNGEWMYIYTFLSKKKMWKCRNMYIHNVFMCKLFLKLKKIN